MHVSFKLGLDKLVEAQMKLQHVGYHLIVRLKEVLLLLELSLVV